MENSLQQCPLKTADLCHGIIMNCHAIMTEGIFLRWALTLDHPDVLCTQGDNENPRLKKEPEESETEKEK